MYLVIFWNMGLTVIYGTPMLSHHRVGGAKRKCPFWCLYFCLVKQMVNIRRLRKKESLWGRTWFKVAQGPFKAKPDVGKTGRRIQWLSNTHFHVTWSGWWGFNHKKFSLFILIHLNTIFNFNVNENNLKNMRFLFIKLELIDRRKK